MARTRLVPASRPSATPKTLALLALALLVGIGRSAAQADPPAQYLVGAGDVLSVAILSGDAGQELTPLDLQVSGDGTISVIYLGTVPVAGLSSTAIADKLRRQLISRDVFHQPHVSVNVKEYLSQGVNVAGMVHSPGRHFLHGPTRLMDVISLSGGIDELEAGEVVQVMRQGAPAPILIQRGDLVGTDLDKALAANIYLLAGDTIHVPRMAQVERTPFCVLGPVNKPDCYEFEGALTLEEALAKAGGLDLVRADRRHIMVRRVSGGSLQENVLDLDAAGVLGARFPIQKDDQILVGETKHLVTVDGEVKSAGQFPLTPGMTLTDAIALAGGAYTDLGFGGAIKRVQFRRGAEVREVDVKAILNGKGEDILLQSGDRIFVPRRRY